MSQRGAYAKPVVAGLLIAIGAILPFTWLARVNATVRPDLPWAAAVTVAYLAVFIAWLNGSGPPSRNSAERRQLLRLWPPAPRDTTGLSAGAIVGILSLLYLAWIGMSLMSPIPDLSAYPTTSYRWSMFLMGGITAGVTEEVAFRGYMLSGLERFDRANAIWITSLAFVLLHLNHGIGTVLLLAPGMFATSVLLCMLARRTGTILPGMAFHVLGDRANLLWRAARRLDAVVRELSAFDSSLLRLPTMSRLAQPAKPRYRRREPTARSMIRANATHRRTAWQCRVRRCHCTAWHVSPGRRTFRP